MTRIKVGDGLTPWKDLPYVTASDAAKLAAHTWGELAGKSFIEDETSVTDKLKLTQPAYSDVIDVAVLNSNSDIIDEKFIDLEGEINTLELRLQALIEGATPEDNLE